MQILRSFHRSGARFAAYALLAGATLLAACAKPFAPAKYTDAMALYRASVDRFNRHKWSDAIAGFDRLASQLPARDTLLPRIYFYQGEAHAKQGEHLLSAQAYARIQDAFPDDSLGDDALYEQGREYRKLWRRPTLDAQYGQTSLATFRQFLTVYPDSPKAADAGVQIAVLNQMFAAKDLEAGLHYFRRKAYDPALIYFKDVVRLYPGTAATRTAYLRMTDSYRAIHYGEELAETCTEMRRLYQRDAEVSQSCADAKAPTVATPTPPPGAVPSPAPNTTGSVAPTPASTPR